MRRPRPDQDGARCGAGAARRGWDDCEVVALRGASLLLRIARRPGSIRYRAAVHSLQFAGGLHGAQVAADGLLRDSEAVRDVDDVDPALGGRASSLIAW